jgi:hypothetical protein
MGTFVSIVVAVFVFVWVVGVLGCLFTNHEPHWNGSDYANANGDTVAETYAKAKYAPMPSSFGPTLEDLRAGRGVLPR